MTAGLRRYLVLSDAHFGTPESSVNTAAYAAALVEHTAEGAPWEEIVLAGDLLDVNLSTLTRSIEGGACRDVSTRLFGFRHFLEALHAAMRARDPAKGLADLARRWVYIPGNHDYKIWDMLSTKVACEDVLRDGQRMGAIPTPLRQHTWTGLESFFAGIFRPFDAQDRVIVTYPNHEAVIDGDLVLFTHGHYLDPSQTRWNDLHAEVSAATSAADRRKRVRRIFIETAQYQSVANAVSFTRSTRRVVSDLVGPEGALDKLRKLLMRVGGWILRLLFLGDRRRRRSMSRKQLLSIESYVTHFCARPRSPRWFVFGHTHRQDLGRTPSLGIEVFNAGSFYPDRGMPMTFLEIEAAPGASPRITLMCVDASGKVGPSNAPRRGTRSAARAA
jgi:UDP-2,3-diacylglucosamine pyrophosphatase LpxH